MIAFIDLETTGLNPAVCSIIEVACVVTDNLYNEVDRYESLVAPYQDRAFRWEEGALKMHKESGLFDLWEKNAIVPCGTVDKDLCVFLKSISKEQFILGGQSVHFDESFMKFFLFNTKLLLSHRHLDVSGLKLFVSFQNGIPTENLPPIKSKTTHRAMDDILASIEAAKFYRDNLLYIPALAKSHE